MRKADFLDRLRNALAGLPSETVDEILADFDEHFRVGLASGRPEEEIALELGIPEDLALAYRETADRTVPSTAAGAGPAESVASSHREDGGEKAARIVFAVLALLFFDLVILLPLLAVLVTVLAVLWAIAAVLLCLGPALVIAGVAFSAAVASPGLLLASICFGIALLALAILGILGMAWTTRGFILVIRFLVRLHMRIVKGGSAA